MERSQHNLVLKKSALGMVQINPTLPACAAGYLGGFDAQGVGSADKYLGSLIPRGKSTGYSPAIKKFESLIGKHARIGVDSSVFIYLFEQHQRYEPLCAAIIDSISRRSARLISASITLSEVLVRPLEQKNAEVVALYENAFRSMPNFSLVPIDYTVAKTAAILRASYSVLLPDAIHIACALKEGATLFVTNDIKLKRISDISIACLNDYA